MAFDDGNIWEIGGMGDGWLLLTAGPVKQKEACVGDDGVNV